ncbi:MAG: phosphoribosyltransferase family protein [Fimbriimonadales bacterium]
MRVETVLTEEQIASRIHELAKEIHRAYADSAPLLLSILKGSVFFLADLARELGSGYPIDFMAVASYDGTRSTRAVEFA